MEERARVTEADWEDFWYAPEKFGTWHPEDTKNGDDIVVSLLFVLGTQQILPFYLDEPTEYLPLLPQVSWTQCVHA